MSIQSKKSKWNLVKKAMLLFTTMTLTLLYAGYASAGATDIGQVASTLTSTLANVAKFVTAASYVIGFMLCVSAFLKFKAHKDNPQGTPLGVPMMLLFVGAGLIFLPSIFSVAGGSLGLSVQASIGGVSSF
jgi:intracellular multiplication protein IcmD